MAEVNDKGDITVEGEFVGRLEGFRFIPDKVAAGVEAKMLKSWLPRALAPQFHLRADRFYNAPDTEIDFTEQGGLMWGAHAVGKLVAGTDVMRPRVEVFVDEAANPDVRQKVQRRSQHFIDHKIATLFEPLLNLRKDEALAGLVKRFAFRVVEAFGILPRGAVARDVRDLDQDARGALRKHGIRFGQFTVFVPLLLKPAPTRLRLVLWSLANGLDKFPEAPPPGLVTVPTAKDAPDGYSAMSGYVAAGDRSIRIDMLERLADMLRDEDSRGGFEARADMLSITGMTLDQFAGMMRGLGYRVERGEREKLKAPPKPTELMGTLKPDADAMPDDTTAKSANGELTESTVTVPSEPGGALAGAPIEPVESEIEIFYTFFHDRSRLSRPRHNRDRSAASRLIGKSGQPRHGKLPAGEKSGLKQGKGTKSCSARPSKLEKPIDPDHPFAMLLAFKDSR
ncbi:MAG: hypothetical protein GDA36_10760 [Rhodobacteraceae bacterium]|nr:hypothetical protein [Paracoccaceae bacterium]